ncbi:hypothetical protein R5W23_006454 [Gemmata sp. JC673]|uniref:DUF4013 domain-containing protein n=1 Tax=Gemmata algarum TaxID=2975278 RepID=A0ABU5EVQ5_9BACT|nr:hypothetical protein [Gemmata algarum]MDY3559235.1 hypothetical protein [Gemmata algarum]
MAEPIPEAAFELPPEPERDASPLFRVVSFAGAGAEWCFGAVVLLLGLAVLAAVPLGQFLVLGYLLEASGRVARSGRIRDGFIGVRRAALFGGAAFAGGVMWLPLYLMSLQAEAARIIDPHGAIARRWEIVLGAFAVVFVLHAAGALFWGGRVRHFLNPINVPWLAYRLFQGGMYQEARDRVWELTVGLRLPYYFWLGLRGFVGAFLWLACPLFLLGLGHKFWGVGLLGAALLSVVVLYVPFLQTRFARARRFAALFEVRKVRAVYRRAPLAFAFALWVHLLFAMPLYVLKIELVPRELFFVEGLFFLLFIFPARLVSGWAYARGARRRGPRFWLSRWAGRFAAVPVVLAYVFAVWVSQHIGWAGVSSLYEQHAFLLPVPFVTWR